MKIKIEEKNENTLLKRQDISFQVDHTGTATPPRRDVRAKLAAMLNCKEDQLYIVRLAGLYGQSISQGYAHLYPSKEAALELEQDYIKKRHAIEEAPQPTPVKPPEPAPEEKPPKAEPPKKKEPEKPPKAEPPKKKEPEKPPKEVTTKAPKKETKPKKEKPRKENAEKPSAKKEAS